jgi:leucyl/phenylalanyl-tRNA--protein transferase
MLEPSRFFPPVEEADYYGVVARGGELSTSRLIDAYRHGIFPWPNWLGIVEWHSPPWRAVIEFDAFHVSRRLAQTIRQGVFQVTSDRDFRGVITGCATAATRAGHTWITPAIVEAYCRLHAEGVAHSVEAWREGCLVGGVYGVAIGGMFAAESMFYRESNASKVALAGLVRHLAQRGFTLFDIQQWTANSSKLGCSEMARDDFIARLDEALAMPVTFGSIV